MGAPQLELFEVSDNYSQNSASRCKFLRLAAADETTVHALGTRHKERFLPFFLRVLPIHADQSVLHAACSKGTASQA